MDVSFTDSVTNSSLNNVIKTEYSSLLSSINFPSFGYKEEKHEVHEHHPLGL